MDLYGVDKGNVSLPPRLQTLDFKETEKKNTIINTQKCFYDLKIAESKRRIQRLKKSLYNCLVDLSNVFQVEQHIPHSISKLLSENIVISNQSLMFVEDMTPKKQDCILYNNEKEKYKSKINDARLSTKQSIIITKLGKATSDMLSELCYRTNIKLFELVKFDHLPEEQYVVNTDYAMNKAQKHERYEKQLEVLLYREEEKLAIANYHMEGISDLLQAHLQMLCDAKYVLANLKTEYEKMCNCK